MAKKVQPKILPGFMELLPKDQIQFNRILDTIQGVFESFGFMPIDTPIIERAEILLAKAGDETEKQIYRFKKGDNDLALRFDLTVPLARYVAQRYNELIFPFRRYQIGKVFRGERQQKGRFREFYQCDVDVIGNEKLDLLYDAEMAAIIYAVFKKLNFRDFTIKINNRKILNGFFEAIGVAEKSSDILRIIDKFSKIGKEAVIKELTSFLLDKDMALKVVDFIQIKGDNDEILKQLDGLADNETFKTGVKELKQVMENAEKFGAPNKTLVIDLTISRGFEYYTGTVYETFLDKYPEIGSVCSGGRFDNLAEYYTDKKLPGVGISIGLTRLFYQLKEADLMKGEETASQVLVVPLNEDSEKILDAAVEAADELRNAGINTELYLGVGIKPDKKIKYADKRGIAFVIFIGEEEIKKGVVALKNMETSEQKDVSIEDVIEIIKKQ